MFSWDVLDRSGSVGADVDMSQGARLASRRPSMDANRSAEHRLLQEATGSPRSGRVAAGWCVEPGVRLGVCLWPGEEGALEPLLHGKAGVRSSTHGLLTSPTRMIGCLYPVVGGGGDRGGEGTWPGLPAASRSTTTLPSCFSIRICRVADRPGCGFTGTLTARATWLAGFPRGSSWPLPCRPRSSVPGAGRTRS